MGKNKMNTPWGYGGYVEEMGYVSKQNQIDNELEQNKKTDEQQSQEIASESQERQTADESIDARIKALEEASGGSGDSSALREEFDEFTGTTYAADKSALEEKDAELQSAIDTLNGDGDGSVKKIAEDAASEAVAAVVAEAPEDFDTLKEVAEYIASDKTNAAEIETKLGEHDDAISALETKDAELEAKDAELEAAIAAIDVPSVDGLATEEALNNEVQAREAADEALDAKIDAIEIPSIDGLATVEALNEEVSARTAADDGIADTLNAEVARAMEAEQQLTEAIAEKATNEALTIESERAIAAENAKVEKEINGTNGKALIFNESDGGGAKFEHNDGTWSFAGVNDGGQDGIAGQIYALKKNENNKFEGSRIDITKDGMYYTVGDASAADRLVDANKIATEGVVDEKIGDLEIPSIDGLAETTAVTAEIAAAVAILNAKDAEQDADIANKANAADVYAKDDADNMFQPKGNYATENELSDFLTIVDATNTYQPKGDYATKAEIEEAGFATETYVSEEVEKVVGAAPENFDTLKELADALADLKVVDVPAVEGEHYTQEEIDAAQEGDDAYGKTVDDWKVEPVEEVSHNMTIGEFVNTMMQEVNEKPEVNALNEKMNAMENALKRVDANVYQTMMNDLEVLDTLKDANTVTIEEGTIGDIVVPETTRSKTITGELEPEASVTLTSRYGLTINNSGSEPTNIGISAPAVEGYNAATVTLNGGEYNTITLTDASLATNTAATIQNVVITEETSKPLTVNAMFEDGATVTSYSDAPITLTNKNAAGDEVDVVVLAPNSTVTLSGGKWGEMTATVANDTLIVKKSAHIDTLVVNQGHVIVEVASTDEISTVIGNYDPENPMANVDYLKKEITQANVADMQSVGECTLMEDVVRSGNFSVGTFASDSIVWELNGHNITVNNTRGYGGFRLRGSAKLVVDGPGSMTVNDDYALWAYSSDGAHTAIVINGGDFEGGTHVLYAEKGVIEVNGGTFKLTNPDECEKDVNGNFKFLLNCLDSAYTAGNANIIVRGGKFYGFNPAVSYGEPSGPISYVAQGFHVVETVEDGMKVYEVVAD